MPGVPSLYYGSEWGLNEQRTPQSDVMLRPSLNLAECQHNAPVPDLERALQRLISLRQGSEVLRYGDYTQIYVSHEQLAFLRESDHERVLVVLNAHANAVPLEITLPYPADIAVDLLNPGIRYTVSGTRLSLPDIPPRWARVLRLE
jgi:glycosidase